VLSIFKYGKAKIRWQTIKLRVIRSWMYSLNPGKTLLDDQGLLSPYTSSLFLSHCYWGTHPGAQLTVNFMWSTRRAPPLSPDPGSVTGIDVGIVQRWGTVSWTHLGTLMHKSWQHLWNNTDFRWIFKALVKWPYITSCISNFKTRFSKW
jgi:hypothetical protein